MMGVKIFTLILLLSWADGKSLRQPRSVLQFPPQRPFSRGAVETQPPHDSSSQTNFAAALRRVDSEEIGSRRLPLRAAVESIPPHYGRLAQEPAGRIPLRDSVEKRPPAYDDDLFALTDELESLGIDPWSRDTTNNNQKPPDKIEDPDTPHHYVIQLHESTKKPPMQTKLQYYGAAKPYNKKPPSRVDQHYAAYTQDARNNVDHQFRIDNQFQELVGSREISPHESHMNLMQNEQSHGRFFHEERRQTYEAEPPRHVVCYVSGWAVYRKAPLGFSSAWLPPVCSHVIYEFATLDPHQLNIVAEDREYDIVQGGYRTVTGLKMQQPDLKVIIAIGGLGEEAGRRLELVASSPESRQKFARNAVEYCREYGFDGIHIQSEYPGIGADENDKNNLVMFLKEIRNVFEEENLILTMSVPASRYRVEDGFDVPAVGGLVDFVVLHAFDLQADKKSCSIADHHSPLLPRPTDISPTDNFNNVDYSVRYWLRKGFPRSRLVVAVPPFGRSFKLENSSISTPGSRASGPGDAGMYTNTKGFLAYFEICEALESGEWKQDRDAVGSPYMVKDDQWVGYDDSESIRNKMLYVRSLNLAGGAIWADLDDFRGLCGQTWPLLSAVSNTLKELPMIAKEGMRNLGPCMTEQLSQPKFETDPANCAAFFRCKNGQKYRVACVEGTFFDPDEAVCRVMDPSKCLPGQSRVAIFPDPSVNEAFVNKDLTRDYFKVRQEDGEKLVVCYMTNWAFYRKGEGKFVPEHVDPRLCSHVIYAYASLEPDNLVPKEFDPWADIDNNLYARVTSLKDTKVLLGIGGWTDSAGDKYSRLVRSPVKRASFVDAVVMFLHKHNFAGLHLDWNYPKCWQSNCAKGPESDKPNFTKLVQELSVAFKNQKPALILGVSVSGYKEVIDVGYELLALSKAADFLSAMTYDYHGGWENTVQHGSPLYSKPQDKYPQYTMDYAIKYLISKGADPDKLLLGLPFYGQTYQLEGSNIRGSRKGPGTAAAGPGEPGEFTKQNGMMAYYEICKKVKDFRWQVGRQDGAGPYAYSQDQWVGYEDPKSVTEKVEYALKQGLGGVVAWSVDLDDYSNMCCGEPYPLLRAAGRALKRRSVPALPNQPCQRPDPPSTPSPPVMTTVFDSGAPASSTGHEHHSSSTTPWWTPPSTTTTTTTTQAPTPSSTPWWAATSTTTQTTTSTTARPPSSPMAAEVPTTDCQTGEYKPDPGSCTSYLHCAGGEYRKQSCAPGLHWNSKLKLCDWPAAAKCQGGFQDETTSQKPVTQTVPMTMRPTWDYTTKHTTIRPTSKPPKKPSRPTKKPEKNCITGNYYAHTDCSMYNICVNGVLVSQSCAPGEGWSQGLAICAPGVCRHRKPTRPSKTRPKYTYVREHTCQEGNFSPHPTDLCRYLLCVHGQRVPFKCSPGLHWDKDMLVCNWPKSKEPCSDDTTMFPDEPELVDSGEDIDEPSNPDVSAEVPSQPDNGYWTPSKPSTTTTSTPDIEDNNVEPLNGYYKIVCYFTNWAWYRRGIGKYVPENIDPKLCTHIVYGFAVLDSENLVIKAHDSWADFDNRFYERVTAFKKKGLKVLLALGGWNDSAGDKYSKLVNNANSRKRFLNHALSFLEKHNFDGLDLDWEYPVCWQTDCTKGPESDKAAFSLWVQELAAAFRPRGLLLSAAVSASKTVIDAGYDVPAMAKHMDWIAVMAYDYHGQWDKKTGHVAPLYYHPEDDVSFFNANYSMHYWISQGAPSRKLVMGMPLYGQSFTTGTSWDTPPALLANKDKKGLNVPARAGGQAGEHTKAQGFLAYYEICDRIKNRGWIVQQDPEGRMGPHAYKGDQWVGFDDREMIRKKTEFVKDLNLGGAMIWALDLDDFKNSCNEGAHPLLSTIRDVLKDATGPEPGTSLISGPVIEEPEKEPPPPPLITESPPQPSPPEAVVIEDEYGGTGDDNSVEEGDGYKMVCYFTNWAWYRQGEGKYLPSDIDPALCTHIVYGFAVLDTQSLTIKPHDSWADIDNKFYEKVTSLRSKNKKVLLAIGGWNDSAGNKYSKLVNSASSRRKFVLHVLDFILNNKFDGLDLDWEYPVCWQVECDKGPASDKEGFSALVQELRQAFAPHDLLLSSAVSPNRKVIDAGYDVPVLSENLDWIAVMTYDYHGQWDKKTGHIAPMYEYPDAADKFFNVNSTIHHWIMRGADPAKLVLGMPLYGQSFSLSASDQTGLNTPTYGGGEAGDFTRARGFLSYYEICTRIRTQNWKVVHEPRGRMGPYAFKGDQWVSFDDIPMIRHKANYLKAMGLGGGMIWALDLDDFRGTCGCEKYPLLSAAARELGLISSPQPACILELPVAELPSENEISPPSSQEVEINVQPIQPVIPLPQDMPLSGGPCLGRIFAPDPMNCNKYFLCNQGVLQTQNCPPGLHWNKDHCDWPASANCKPGVMAPTTSPPVVTTSIITPAPVSQTTTTTEAYPIKPAPAPGKMVVCYFTNWAWYRQGDGKYLPEDIDSTLCTHVAYGFAVLDAVKLTITPHDSWADIDNDFYGKVTALRKKGIKVLIAIGGWNDSLGDKYSRLVNSPSARARFITNILEFIEKWRFDGLDLDWEYPKCWQVDCNAGPASDKQAFTTFIKELRQAFRPKGLLLSAAVSASKMVIDAGYDVPSISRDLDWIAVMTYDYHGSWDRKTGHVAPLYNYPGDTYDYFNANFSLNYWIQKGADPRKVIMGIPLYGQSFTLVSSSDKGMNSPAIGGGEAGDFTKSAGFLSYYEICDRVKRSGWSVERDPQGRIGPYARRGLQWVSFDDTQQVARKVKLAQSLGLGGTMVWALDLDDFRGKCNCGSYPLLKTINAVTRAQSPVPCDL